MSWWLRSIAGRIPNGPDGVAWAKCGRAEVRAPMMFAAMANPIANIAARSDVLVADLTGEPLGFVCLSHEDGMRHLHYIFVTGEARRKGLGTMLFRHAIKGDYTPTFMTRAGRALEEHALRLIAADQGQHERSKLLE